MIDWSQLLTVEYWLERPDSFISFEWQLLFYLLMIITAALGWYLQRRNYFKIIGPRLVLIKNYLRFSLVAGLTGLVFVIFRYISLAWFDLRIFLLVNAFVWLVVTIYAMINFMLQAEFRPQRKKMNKDYYKYLPKSKKKGK